MKKTTRTKIGKNSGITAEIEEWRQRFELIAEASGQVIYDYNVTDGLIKWSGSIESTLGYKLSEMNGGIRQWEKLIHKDDRKVALRQLEIAEKNLKPYKIEYRYKHKDGHYLDLKDRGYFIYDEQGIPKRMIGMMQDISSQKRSNLLISGLNTAVLEMQKVYSKEDIYKVVAREFKKMDIESTVSLVDEEGKKLIFEYFSYDSKSIKVAEKIAGMSAKNLSVSIENIKEYDEVINNKKTLLMTSNVEFIRQILPKKVKFMAERIIKLFKISRFIIAPLIVDDHVFGMFSVQSDDLLESDIPAVTMFAHQLAGAWQKGELIVKIQQENNIRKKSELILRQSEERFSKSFKSSPFAITISDLNTGRYIDVNENFEKLIGFEKNEIIGKNSVELNIWIDSGGREKTAKRLIKENSIKNIQTDFRNKSGDIRTWKSSLEIIELDEKPCILSMIEDITEQKKAEDLLKESSRKLNTLINNLSGVVYRCMNDVDWTIEFISNGIEELSGYPPEDFILSKVRTYESIIEPEDRLMLCNVIQNALDENTAFTVEYRINCANGEQKWVLEKGRGIKEGEKLIAIEGYISDITSSLKTEKENLLLAQTLKSVKDVISITNMKNDVIFVNDAFLDTYGYSESEIIGKNISIVNPAGFKDVSDKIHKETLSGGYHGELFNIKKDGSLFPVELWTSTVRNTNGNIIATVGVARDITGRLKAEKENTLLAQTLKSVKDAITITDMDNNILFVNDAFLLTYGYQKEEVIGKNISFIVSKNNPKDILEKVRKGTSQGNWNGELIDIRKDGTEFPIELWTSVVKDADYNNIAMVGVARDVSERKKTEKEIENINKKLVQAQRIAKTGSWEILFPSNQRYWSENMYEIMEFPERINITMEELKKRILPDEFEIFKSAIEESIKTGKPYSMDYKIIIPDGTIKYIHDEGEVIKDKFGNTISMFGTTQDITGNKLSEIAIKESEERYRSIFDNAPIGMFHSTIEGQVINLNPGFVKMLGYDSEKELSNLINNIGTASLVYINPEKRAFYMNNVKQTGDWYTFENQYKRKDGNIITAVTTMRSFLNSINGQMEFEGFVTNITERKKIEDNLQKSEERFKQVAESADEWIWEVNTEGLYTYASPVVEKILGYKSEEIVNKKYFYDFFLPEEKEEIKNTAIKFFGRKEKIKNLINKNLHKNGSIIILETNGVPVLDDNNNLSGYRGVDTNITERKRTEDELIKAKERAEEMNKVKTNFLANMSHEVRTPLVAILGFSEVLSGIIKDDELKNYVNMIHMGGERLLDTLNLILDLSVIEAQKIKIDLNPLNIINEVKQVAALFEKTAQRKKLKVEIESEFDSYVINLDAKILRQILNNLINNAIKYTNAGKIIIKLSKEKRDEKDYFAIRVEDTGIGIPENKQNLIWEEFRQVSEGLNRSFEGAGLGLSITKKFVEKLGGKIFLEKSEVEIGSTFTVLFPIEEITDREFVNEIYKNEKSESVKSIKPEILYIEDDPIAIDIVKTFIRDNYNIEGALTGKEGIEKAKNKKYDAIFMDINLGKDMDGLEATKLIREIPWYKYTPIVAITAFAMVGDKEEFYEKGCTHYISKPFTKTEFRKYISEILPVKK